MKTRGWPIVAKIVNSRGQTATIYEPFVRALQMQKLSRAEARKKVADVLRQNGNRPGPVSVEYYLDNTLDYLQRESKA